MRTTRSPSAKRRRSPPARRACRPVGIESDSLELRRAPRAPFESLRAGADPSELHRPAGGAGLGRGLRVPAVMAMEAFVAVQDECDVAVVAAKGLAAGPAMERRRDAAPIEQQDRLAAVLGDLAELAQQRGRQRVAGLAAEIDDTHSRQVGSDALPEVQPLEACPALGPWRRAPEEGDCALQRGPLRRHRARRSAGRTPACTRSRAPRRRRRARDGAAGQRSPSAPRSRSAPRRMRCAPARRAARPRSATSATQRCGRRSALGSGRSSAARARSRGRGRSRLSPARAWPPPPGGRPRSCRCRSRRGAGSVRPRGREPRSAWPAPRAASPSALQAWPRRPARPVGRLRQLLRSRFEERRAQARAQGSSRSSRQARARAPRAGPAAARRRARRAQP